MPVRILHVFDHSLPLHSGYSFRSRAIVREQRALGWLTAHLTSDRQGATGAEPEEVDDLVFHRSPVAQTLPGKLPGGKAWDTVAGLAQPLSRLVEEFDPDLIQAHSPCLTALAAQRLRGTHKRPVVYECRAFWEDAAVDHGTTSEGGPRYRLTKALETRVFKRATAITTICDGLRQDIVSRGVDPQKVTVIPNAVDIDAFRPAGDSARRRVRNELGLDGSYVVGFIGSFYAYEGLDVLLRAAEALQQRIDNIAVLLVGGGPEDEALRELASRMSVPIVFPGRVPQQTVADYYAAIDLLAYPRRSMRLTELVTPLKPLEAMCFERPLVASSVGGHRELIDHEQTALLFAPDSVDALAAAVAACHDNAEATTNRVSTARLFVERERTWSVSVGRYAKVFETVLGRPVC